MSSTQLRGRDPHTGRGIAITVRDGVVDQIHRHIEVDEDVWLAPGLVDLQVNGFGGFDANAVDVDVAHIVGLVEACWKTGATTIAPTVITASEERLVAALRAIGAARREHPLVAHTVPYVHVEGPHLSSEDGPRGVHAADQLRPVDIAEFTRWQHSSDGIVGMVTLSPHFADSASYISALARQGVHVAIGHTHATPEQITAATDAGARLATHLGNGAHPLIQRHPNYLWTQLAEDRLTAGFIADGHHLPPDTLVTMLRAKGAERSFLVSDATALAGKPPGHYTTPVGGQVELSEQGRLSYGGTTLLAGAARSVADGVAHIANLGQFGLGDAIDLATFSPGRFCGGRGQLQVGSSADLLTFRWRPGDPTLSVAEVLVHGSRVFTAE